MEQSETNLPPIEPSRVETSLTPVKRSWSKGAVLSALGVTVVVAGAAAVVLSSLEAGRTMGTPRSAQLQRVERLELIQQATAAHDAAQPGPAKTAE